MFTKHTYIRCTEVGIHLFLICSMLFVSNVELAGFPIYSLLLLITALYLMLVKIMSGKKEGHFFLQMRYLTDILAVATVIIEIFSVIFKMFWDPNEGAINFSIHAEIIALVLFYLLFSNGIQFRSTYFDMILYSGLLVSGLYLYICFTGVPEDYFAGIAAADSGVIASYFMLFCMIGIYSYCISKDRLRTYFYLAESSVGFFALLLNQNILSFWLMTIYFIALPIVIRPTAQLVKRDMQMFFLYGIMMSNMSLLTGYTDIVLKKTSYTLEHSVYLDLLLAVGGVIFFHYWNRIPEGIDLNRLVMRRMRKGYQILLRIILIFLAGVAISADHWALTGDNMSDAVLKEFVLPLVEVIRKSESGFYVCFRDIGIVGGVFTVFFLVLLVGRLRKNWGFDKPVTGILILISFVFLLQTMFWKPPLNMITVYFILLLSAAFNKEEKIRVRSTKIREETLREQAFLAGTISQDMEKE